MKIIFKILLVTLIYFGFVAFKSTHSPSKKIKILLIGDSTTIGNTPREVKPEGPHLEQMIEQLAQIEGLPELEVINTGKGGDTAAGLLGSDWYKEKIAHVKYVDFIFLRMGINDWFKYKDFQTEFPEKMKVLIGRLKNDHPKAKIIISTICRFMSEDDCKEVNSLIKNIAQDEKLDLFDLYTPYNEFLHENGENSLNVRQMYIDSLPQKYHEWLKPYTHYREGWPQTPSGYVVKVNDISLDPIFGEYKGWYGDRHPNSTGYNLIAQETVKFLKPLLE
ncbi:SGNH/GDSL hydrolase family protein [Zobellia uliginosa]|uniref:SGNH/GDSL hydrolase family protein n=1 Tax=Zobellia uliginosa TaxID=143224 RepID=UPI001C07DE06|nr:SGNH/GDSL hydrolase family protein [Zobellia uliginosa]MBU2945746.1 SGNH/GDSL hydrolase family protein [Zobellia uliginosa]